MTNISDDQSFIIRQESGFEPLSEDGDLSKSWADPIATAEQRQRDGQITKLLEEYVNYYTSKSSSNRKIKIVLFIICSSILCSFALSLLAIIIKYIFLKQEFKIEDTVQLITVSITFITLVFEILKIITQYIYPTNDEEYITRIVELIQKNDLENKKENFKTQESLSKDKKIEN